MDHPQNPVAPEAYYWMNKSELCEILRRRGHRVRRALTHERLVQLILTQESPRTDELSETTQSRLQLEQFIGKNPGVDSQLACSGSPGAGKCTTFDCSDGRHTLCHLGASIRKYLI